MALVVLGFGAFAACVTIGFLANRYGFNSFTVTMTAGGVAGLLAAAIGFWIRRRTDPLR
jgi:hypothetical protein